MPAAAAAPGPTDALCLSPIMTAASGTPGSSPRESPSRTPHWHAIARRVPGTGGDRHAACNRACRGDRLDPDRGVVQRAAPVRRHADRPPQPCSRSRRGRRRARRTGGTGRSRRTRHATTKRSPRTSTRRTAISSSLPACMPTRLATPTSQNTTTRTAPSGRRLQPAPALLTDGVHQSGVRPFTPHQSMETPLGARSRLRTPSSWRSELRRRAVALRACA